MTSPVQTKITDLTPVLEVNDLKKTLEYYQDVLGFTVDWKWPEDGDVDHASVSIGNGHGDASDRHDDHHAHIQLSQADDIPVRNSGWLYFNVKNNIEDLYDQMKERGAEISYDLGDRPWGMREFDVKENNGHIFRFAWAIPLEQ